MKEIIKYTDNGKKIVQRIFSSKDVEKLIYFSTNGHLKDNKLKSKHFNDSLYFDKCEKACKLCRDIKGNNNNAKLTKKTPIQGGFEKWCIEEECLLEDIIVKILPPRYYALYIKDMKKSKNAFEPIFEDNHEDIHKNKLKQCETYRKEWLQYVISIITGKTKGFQTREQVLQPFMLKFMLKS